MPVYQMQFHADRDELLDHWLELVLELEEITHQGATVVDPRSGARMHLPGHRHAPGAHDLAMRGVRMLAAAGPTYFELDDVLSRRTQATG